ncbi:hypothetical protein AMTR_s00088p00037040 [Amborella trichopoda]|uniref:Uncharacterized protein n=1 Tax=Amborella trichopoda TaxID=13333 RepID=W1NV60_AMBTC|nr:hypothetical protein AMTR_s00088p00037040 [Amborella trichopoda]
MKKTGSKNPPLRSETGTTRVMVYLRRSMKRGKLVDEEQESNDDSEQEPVLTDEPQLQMHRGRAPRGRLAQTQEPRTAERAGPRSTASRKG